MPGLSLKKICHSSPWDAHLEQTNETMLPERVLQNKHTGNSTEQARANVTNDPESDPRNDEKLQFPRKRRAIRYITPTRTVPSFDCVVWNGPTRPCGAWSSAVTARRGLFIADTVGVSLNWGTMKQLPPAL